MIITIGANPALDYIVETDSLRVNALNRVTDSRWACGGKSLNFAVAAKAMGIDCMASGFLAGRGDMFRKLYSDLGIRSRFIDVEGEIRTNIKIRGADGTNTEINGAGFSVPADKQEQLIELICDVETDMLVCSGSLPPEVGEDFYYRLANAVGGNVKFACDCEKKVLMASLMASPVLIKPNRFELESVVGTQLLSYADIINAARYLITRGAQNVLVSMGAEGALIVNASSAFTAQYTQNIKPLNLSGCGDTMFAAACDIYLKGGNLIEMLSAGVAAATLAVTSPSIEDMDIERLDGIRKNIKIEAIQ